MALSRLVPDCDRRLGGRSGCLSVIRKPECNAGHQRQCRDKLRIDKPYREDALIAAAVQWLNGSCGRLTAFIPETNPGGPSAIDFFEARRDGAEDFAAQNTPPRLIC